MSASGSARFSARKFSATTSRSTTRQGVSGSRSARKRAIFSLIAFAFETARTNARNRRYISAFDRESIGDLACAVIFHGRLVEQQNRGDAGEQEQTDGSGRDAEHELGPAFRDLPVLRVRVDGGGNCGCTLLLP